MILHQRNMAGTKTRAAPFCIQKCVNLCFWKFPKTKFLDHLEIIQTIRYFSDNTDSVQTIWKSVYWDMSFEWLILKCRAQTIRMRKNFPGDNAMPCHLGFSVSGIS